MLPHCESHGDSYAQKDHKTPRAPQDLWPLGTPKIPRRVASAKKFPEKVVYCLELIVRGDKEGWGIYGWQDHARIILEKSMRSGGRAQQTADGVINYLGTRGHHEFRDILKNMGNA